jgi:hypothetical protein
MKFPRPIRHRWRNSRRTPSWPWSPRRWPRTCFSSITMEQKETTERKISPHGENHFSKRSEDDNKSKNREVMIDSKTTATKSESENKSKDIMTDSKTKGTKRKEQNVTAKADKAEAIKRTKNEIKVELESQQDKFRKYLALTEPILQFSVHLHLEAAFTISILFFNDILSDHFDHHFMYPFRTFTLKDFRGCKKHFSLRTKALHLARTAATQPTIPESTRLPRNPETRPDVLAKDLHRNTLVPVTLQLTGQPRNSENNTQIDSFIFT